MIHQQGHIPLTAERFYDIENTSEVYWFKLGMSEMKITKLTIFMLLNLACLLNIGLWPVNKYEWMLLDEPEMVLPIDDKAPIYFLFSGLPILLLLLYLIGEQTTKAKLMVAFSVSLLISLWLFKYRSMFFQNQ